MKSKVCIKVIFKGKVQGVFFRQHVKKYAFELKIDGYVKNLSDGRVEMIAISTQENLDKLLEMIKEKPGNGAIHQIEKSYFKNEIDYRGFEIIN